MRIPPFLLALLPFLAAFSASAQTRSHHPVGYMQRLQNDLADEHHLPRFKDLKQLSAAVDDGKLVKVTDTDAYRLDVTLGEYDPDHRGLYAHAQPWTKSFLDQVLGKAHDKFGTRYAITSLVRTQRYQELLCGKRHARNANAICGGTGWHRSAHLTGAAVDIGRLGLSEEEQGWIRDRLNALWAQGKLVYIPEGGQQYCFHVMVLPEYARVAKAAVSERRRDERRKRHKTPPQHAKHGAGGRHKARQ